MLKHLRSDITGGRTIILLGVAIACIYWFGAGIEHSFMHNNGDIIEALFPSDIPDMIIRLFVVGTGIGFSFYTRSLINRLLAVHKQYKTLFENAPDAIFITDVTTGIITGANPAAEKLLLRSYDQIVGLHQSKLHPPKKRDDSTTIFLRQIEENKESRKARAAENVILRSDGVEVPVEIMAKTIDLGGRSVLQGIFRDVTERKEIRERDAAILRTSMDGFWLIDTTGQIHEVNDAYCRMSGYSREELLSMKVEDVEANEKPEDITRHIRAIAEAGPHRFETQHRLKDGTIVDLDVSAHYIAVDRGRIFAFLRDITQIKKLERDLSRSEEKYRTFFENALTGDFISTPDGALIDCNQAFLDIFGFTSKLEAKSINMESVYPIPEARETMLDKIRTEKKIVHYEHEARKITGEPIIIDQNTVGEFDDDNNLVLMRGDIIDVTDRKEAEEKLKQSEERFRLAMEVTEDALWDWNLITNKVYRNPRHAVMLGYDPNELSGSHEEFRTWIHPDDKDLVFGLIHEYLNGRRDPFNIEYRMLKKSGDFIWVLGRGKVVACDEDGLPLRMVGTNIDITDRKKMEEVLRESEIKYRTLVEGAGAAISTVNKDGIFLFMNEFAASLLGGKPQDYIGKTMWDLFPKDIADRQVASILKVIHSGNGMNVSSLTMVQNESRWYSTSLEPLRDGNSQISSAMVIGRDITDLKKAEEQLETYRLEMVRTERLASMGTVSAMAAHELTQPLTVIQLSIQNAIDELHEGPSSEKVRKKLTGCLQEVSTITSIVDRFRNFARRSSGQPTSEVDLHVVGEKIVGLLSVISRRRGVSLLLMDLEKLPRIHTSEKDIEQIFFALINNAIQAKDEKDYCQVIVSGTVKDHHIELVFSDDCGGIAPENLDMIFEPFFTTKPEGQGTGLGLTIVRDILSRLGGKVGVESNFGEGSKFVITLPINIIDKGG